MSQAENQGPGEENNGAPSPHMKGARIGLHRLRAAAPTQALVDALASEPPEILGPGVEPQTPAHPNRVVSDSEQMQMMREWAAGANLSEMEERYGVTRGYLRAAMLRKFGSKERLLAALQNLIAENAVSAQMIAQAKMHELTGAQAVFAGKLLVETMVSLDNHVQARPKTINFSELAGLGRALKEIKAVVTRSNPQPPSTPA